MPSRYRSVLIAGLAIAVVVAVSSAWLASSHPDGLERVAEDHEFIDRAEEPWYETLPDYTVPGIDHEQLSTALAGVIGILVVTGLAVGVGYFLRSRDSHNSGA